MLGAIATAVVAMVVLFFGLLALIGVCILFVVIFGVPAAIIIRTLTRDPLD